MNINKAILLATISLPLGHTASADKLVYMPMEISGGDITEKVTGNAYPVNTATTVETVAGVKGNAVRFDGYSTYIESELKLGSLNAFTFSLWCAMETWPIIEHDTQNESEMTCIAGNYDQEAKTGFGFFVGRTGKLAFKFYSMGWPGEINAESALPLYQWNNLVAVSNGTNVMLYNNGVLLGTTKCKGVSGDGHFIIGKSAAGRTLDSFCLNTINGIVDEVEIYNEEIDASTIAGWATSGVPALTDVGEGRYDDDLMRPRLHGMTARNWTNETHGLVDYNGQYHLFFQKNANGPYMSRLQWGHLVSDNLFQWQEMPIAIGSDKWYDLKGCWSGCIAVDDEVTSGKPNIIYTGVDYARAMIAQAAPEDENLLNWSKSYNPIIDGRPAGLSDDFRDPYFFRNGDNAYIIVGTSKDGKGTCTLHRYDAATKTWSNDGQIFFAASNAAFEGSFWEMPNLTKIGDKWLFTVTPLGLNDGVKALYWVGTINADGTFSPSSSSTSIEFPGFAKDGFGLLSPSIMQTGGKTIAMGIVPDKLDSRYNYDLGWAHTYSLPREWSLGADGQLMQRPYAGLEAMRDVESKRQMTQTLDGYVKIADMGSRQVEAIGEFTVGDADFGFVFYSDNGNGAKLCYSPSTATLSLDLRQLDRWHNDDSAFGGLYTTSLPSTVAKGSTMRMHVFIDHSIIDIFINDTWASSVRLFPTENAGNGIEMFSDGGATQADVTTYSINATHSGVNDVFADVAEQSLVDVYSLAGVRLRSRVSRETATAGLPAGFYLVGNKKTLVR